MVNDGGLCFSEYSEGDPFLAQISERLNQLNKSSMSIKSAFSVTYYNVTEFRRFDKMSFQLVVFTDGAALGVFYIYHSSFQWVSTGSVACIHLISHLTYNRESCYSSSNNTGVTVGSQIGMDGTVAFALVILYSVIT